jgi:hypothetical protein
MGDESAEGTWITWACAGRLGAIPAPAGPEPGVIYRRKKDGLRVRVARHVGRERALWFVPCDGGAPVRMTERRFARGFVREDIREGELEPA